MTTSWTSRARRAAIIRSASGLEPLSRDATREQTFALYSVKAEFEMHTNIHRHHDGEISDIFKTILRSVRAIIGIEPNDVSLRAAGNTIVFSWWMDHIPSEFDRRAFFDHLSNGLRLSGRSFDMASSWVDRLF